jgi:predicted porin
MKKSLLALAVLSAIAGTASAQSSVTLSGIVDAGIRRVGVATPSGTDTDWQVGGSQSGYNALTFSGREDLGGGMYAFFALNHRFRINNGTVNSESNTCAGTVPTPTPSVCTGVNTFWRNTAVGLGGGFGDVRLGRILMPLQDMNGGFDPWATGTVGSIHTGGITATIRANNAVYYRSPSLGGVSIHAAIAAGEGQLQGETANNFGQVAGRGALGGQERPIGASIRYAAGPVNVGLAYDKNYADIKTVGAYGSFDFGFMKLMGQFEKGDSQNAAGSALFVGGPTKENMKNYSIGIRAPLGPVTILAGAVRADSDLDNRDGRKFAVGLEYSLSKRTNLYTNAGKSSGDRFTDAQRKAAFDVGVTHRF